MQQIIFFIQKYKYFLFFLLLESIAIFLIINNNNFHKSKFVNSSNRIVGGFYEKTSQISDYFHLKQQNTLLVDENMKLKNQLAYLNSKTDTIFNTTIIDSVEHHQKYSYISGKIINNNYHKTSNFITINKGEKEGVTVEMGVINSKGIIGITDDTSKNYARVQSILNKNSKINARLKNSNYFGSLSWNAKDYNIVQLTDIPKQASIQIGDTIITGGKSTIFPEGILIGTVLNINKRNTAANSINIKLFNDMSNIKNIYVIKSLDKIEIRTLENNFNE